MMTGKKVALVLTAMLLGIAMVGAAGCVRVELPEAEELRSSERVDTDGAEEARVSIVFGAGGLTIGSTHGPLLDAEFVYPDASWEPEIDYKVRGGEGVLSVKQPSGSTLRLLQNQRYLWDLELSDDIPLDLTVDIGAGSADLVLGDLMVRDLMVNLGAGDCSLDLAGTPTGDLDARVNAGAGKLTIRVPRGAGARISGVHDGIGSVSANGFKLDGQDLVNEAYEDGAEFTYTIAVSRGVGEIVIEMVD